MAKQWNPSLYASTARYVADHGLPVVDWLSPQPGERILDLGCGDGVLTGKLIALGCDVVAVDQSAAMVEAARQRGIPAQVMDARQLTFDNEFDAVFTNAVLHWVKEAGAVVESVAQALRPGGRFVGEFGGEGNIQLVCAALRDALSRRGVELDAACGWYFPNPAEYSAVLEEHGFDVVKAELIPRPTPTPGDAREWLANFGDHLLALAPAAERQAILDEVNAALEPRLRGDDGAWHIDYVRIRFAAQRAA
jgi:trans-aconitate methyltransferase